MTTTTPSQSLSGRSVRSGIESQLIQMLASPINPDRSNSGKMLWTIYFWQVVAELAAKREKAAWEEIQKVGGLVDKDDDLRALTLGEHIAVESSKFTVIVEIGAPQKRFNLETFTELAVRQFHISAERIHALAEVCKRPGKKATLSKRVIETE